MLNAKRSVKKKLRVWPRGGEPIKPKTVAKLVQNKNDILSKKVPPEAKLCESMDWWIDRHPSPEIYCRDSYIYIYVYIDEEY